MALNRNPKPTTVAPYDLSTLHPTVHPTERATPVLDINFDTHVPRRSRGRDAHGEHVYWCLSCNRRVANVNQPFCPRHSEERAKEKRRQNREAKKPFKVSAETVAALHEHHRRLARAITIFDNSPDHSAASARWPEVQQRFKELNEFLLRHFTRP